MTRNSLFFFSLSLQNLQRKAKLDIKLEKQKGGGRVPCSRCERERVWTFLSLSPRGDVTKGGKSLIQSKILESFFFAADIRRRRRRRKGGMLLYLHERMVRGGEVRPIFGWGGRCQKRWVSAKCSTTLYFPCGDVCCHWEAGSPKKKLKYDSGGSSVCSKSCPHASVRSRRPPNSVMIPHRLRKGLRKWDERLGGTGSSRGGRSSAST